MKQNIQRWDFSGISSVAQVIIRDYIDFSSFVLLPYFVDHINIRLLQLYHKMCQIFCPHWQKKEEAHPIILNLSLQEDKSHQLPQANVALCLIGSSCILLAPSNVGEAGRPWSSHCLTWDWMCSNIRQWSVSKDQAVKRGWQVELQIGNYERRQNLFDWYLGLLESWSVCPHYLF